MPNTLRSNTLRCPKCLSLDVDCESTRVDHRHTCHTCGFETIAAPTRKTITHERR